MNGMEKKAETAEQKTKERTTYVYMVECEDHSLYTGITTDVKRRMREHFQKGEKGAKYTHSRQVSEIKMVWEAKSYASAARLEYAIKRMKRADKLLLLQQPEKLTKGFLPKLAGESYMPRTEFCMSVTELVQQERTDF